MKALFVGGSGTISIAITRQLMALGCELYLLNRGNHSDELPKGTKTFICDINNTKKVQSLIGNNHFDVIADFIAFTPKQVKRDFELFNGLCDQYIFISSASAYEKPPSSHIITENTPLINPYWEYSRNKADCEKYLFEQHKINGFPVTVVRPSHTYGDKSIPVALHGDNGSWQVIERIKNGKPVIIPGDGESLWTVTHNTDFAPYFISLMGNKSAIGNAYHITSEYPLTWNEIYKTIADELSVSLNAVYASSEEIIHFGKKYGYDFEGGLKGDKSNSVVFDNSKVKAFLPDYKMQTDFKSGVKQCLKYIFDHKECQQKDEKFDKFCDDFAKMISDRLK